jgi:glycosyltransferase involved in cell wall biosynthesis
MTIVILSDEIPPEGKGGAERVAWDTACALQKEGNDVHVITTTRDVRLKNMSAEVTTREGVTVHTFYIAYHPRWRAWVSLYNPVAVKEVRRILNEVKPTLVHAHNIHRFISYESLRVSSKRDIPVFLTAHDFMLLTYGKLAHPSLISPWKDFKSQGLRYNPFRNLIIRRALHSVTEILAVSKAVQEVLVQHGIERVSVLHNGILPQEQEGTPDQIRAFKARI